MTAVLPRVLRAVRLAALALPLLVVTPAFAYGTLTPTTKTLPEVSGGWKMNLTVKLPKAPDPAYQTYRFFFTPVVLYETFMDDTKPTEQTRDLPQDKNTKPIVESLEVGFSDARNQIWDTTKFDFVIKRDRGFEAGMYKVEVRDTNDKTLGSTFTIKLDGKNPMVDRRAMIMTGTKKKEAPVAKKEEPSAAPASAPAAAADGAKTEDGTAAPDAPSAPPPPVKKGCSVGAVPSGTEEGKAGLLLAAGAVALVAARRRRADLDPRITANLAISGRTWHGPGCVCPPFVVRPPGGRPPRAERFLAFRRASLRLVRRVRVAGHRRADPQRSWLAVARRRRDAAGCRAARGTAPGRPERVAHRVRAAAARRPRTLSWSLGLGPRRGCSRRVGRLARAEDHRCGWRGAAGAALPRALGLVDVHALPDVAGRSDRGGGQHARRRAGSRCPLARPRRGHA